MNGNWLPPSTGGGTTGTCTTAKPAANWVCVNGNWLPPWMAPAPTPARRQSRRPNFVCVNGNWLPGDTSGGTSTGLHHDQARGQLGLQERQLAPALVLSRANAQIEMTARAA